MKKTCSKCGVEKALAEFSKSATHRLGVQSACKACKSDTQRAYRSTAEGKAYAAAYARTDPAKKACRRYKESAKGREVAAKASGAYRATEHGQQKIGQYLRSSVGKAKAVMHTNKRRARMQMYIPKAEQAEIDGLYLFCQLFSGFEVDHVVPLNGASVSGLHVLANLQVLQIGENRKKGNKYDVR